MDEKEFNELQDENCKDNARVAARLIRESILLVSNTDNPEEWPFPNPWEET